MSARESGSSISQIRSVLVSGATALVVIWALSWVFGRAFGLFAAIAIFVALLSLTLIVFQIGDISIPFSVSMAMAAGILLELSRAVLPVDAWIAPVAGGALVGLDGWLLAGYGAITITVYWILEARVFSAFRRESGQPIAANPDTVTRYVVRRWSALIDDYRGIVVAVGIFVLVLAQSALGVVGDLGGELFGQLTTMPVVSAFAFYVPVVYTNMGGNLPVVSGLPFFGTLTAGEVGAMGVALLLAAYFYQEGT